MSKIKTYDVVISYPIKVGAESKAHVKEIIMANELLRNAADLKLKITEVKDGSK
tara:strand:+ start:296 stop:457 length:162 start_codon:yes stop_codon:yes gene_type:complete